ncbi:hypothetical protein LguiB_002235 [Lonicera macranthoides]
MHAGGDTVGLVVMTYNLISSPKKGYNYRKQQEKQSVKPLFREQLRSDLEKNHVGSNREVVGKEVDYEKQKIRRFCLERWRREKANVKSMERRSLVEGWGKGRAWRKWMDKCFMMEIHHGGKFVNHPMLYYKGGKVDYMYNIDPDRMSDEELKEHGVVSEGEAESKGEGESESEDEQSNDKSSVASLDNVSDDEELIEARKKKAAIKNCDKSEHGDHNVQTEVHIDEEHEVEYIGRGDAFDNKKDWYSRAYDSLVDEDEEDDVEVRNHPVYKHKPGGPQMEPVIVSPPLSPSASTLRSLLVSSARPPQWQCGTVTVPMSVGVLLRPECAVCAAVCAAVHCCSAVCCAVCCVLCTAVCCVCCVLDCWTAGLLACWVVLWCNYESYRAMRNSRIYFNTRRVPSLGSISRKYLKKEKIIIARDPSAVKRKASNSSSAPTVGTASIVSKNTLSTSTGPRRTVHHKSAAAKKKDKVPCGYGVYISLETGKTFYSGRANKLVQISSQSLVNVPSSGGNGAPASGGNVAAPQPSSPNVLIRAAKAKANSPSVLTRGKSKAIQEEMARKKVRLLV